MTKERETRQIKLLLSPEEHRLVRLAAASRDQAMTEFVRATVMEAVSRELKDLGLASEKTAKTRGAKKRRG
jgi:uncharacterized protein (DUF1778 family)